MTKKHKQEFDLIVDDIINNETFKELDKEFHHGITRYGHSYRVAKGVYLMTKKLGFSTYKEATRAALMHDFYFNNQLVGNSEPKKLVKHSEVAYANASKYYDLSMRQKNMIESHMFPLSKVMPKYKESICITIVDKVVASYEIPRYKLSTKLGIYLLFAFNMLSLKSR